MAGNTQKTYLGGTLNQWATRRVRDALNLLGHDLPCSVVSVANYPILTVNFLVNSSPLVLPQLQVPIFGPEYIRYPIQEGCEGVVFSVDTYIGHITGLGPSTSPTLTQPGNLSALVFFPTGKTGWAPPIDPNSLNLYGPNGAILYNAAKTAILKVTTTEVSVQMPAGLPFVIKGNAVIEGGLALSGNITAEDGTSVYTGTIRTTGDVVANSGPNEVSQINHTHQYNETTGASDPAQTDPPTPGT